MCGCGSCLLCQELNSVSLVLCATGWQDFDSTPVLSRVCPRLCHYSVTPLASAPVCLSVCPSTRLPASSTAGAQVHAGRHPEWQHDQHHHHRHHGLPPARRHAAGCARLRRPCRLRVNVSSLKLKSKRKLEPSVQCCTAERGDDDEVGPERRLSGQSSL